MHRLITILVVTATLSTTTLAVVPPVALGGPTGDAVAGPAPATLGSSTSADPGSSTPAAVGDAGTPPVGGLASTGTFADPPRVGDSPPWADGVTATSSDGVSVGSVSVSDPADQQSANEFLTALRELDGEEALSAYGTMEIVRSRAAVAVQVGEFTDAERRQMSHLLTALGTFVDAYEASQNGSRFESLRLANDTRGAIDDLQAAGGTEYARLARLAVDRFYREQGDRLRADARNASRTPEQIRLLTGAVEAYRAADATDRFSATASNVERIRAEYRADVQELNESAAAAGSFLEGCDGQCGGVGDALSAYGSGVFGRYLTGRQAVSNARQALALAEEHGLSERERSLQADVDATESSLRGLTLASLTALGGYTLAVCLLGAILMTRVTQWGIDTADANIGRIVPREPLEVRRE